MRGALDCYQETHQREDTAQLIEAYAATVKKIAYHLQARLPASVMIDDLFQSGIIGLIEAKNTYNAERGASFDTYASLKIRSQMIDDLRRASGITREISQHIKKIDAAKEALRAEGMPTTVGCIAKHLGIEIEACDKMMQEIQTYYMQSLDDESHIQERVAAQEMSPEGYITHESILQALKDELALLPEREQTLLSLYYFESLNFKEIAYVLSLTEARVCQLHKSILATVKKKLLRKMS